MDWAAIWIDIAGGLLIAGALAAWVPGLVVADDLPRRPPARSRSSGGRSSARFVAIVSFVCSIGNVPLAAVLWNGGISFGGVLAFIFADLIVLPILDIYRKYYGWRMAGFLLGTLLRRRWCSPDSSSSSSSKRPRARSARSATRNVVAGLSDLELHDGPQHHLPRPCSRARLALLPSRRRLQNAEDDERTDGARSRRARARPLKSALVSLLGEDPRIG